MAGRPGLSSEFALVGLDAQQALDMNAFGIELALLDQRLLGDIEPALNLTEGDLAPRQFTLDHSFLRMDQVRRHEFLHDGGFSDDAGWLVQLVFDNARLHWTETIQLRLMTPCLLKVSEVATNFSQ